MTVLSSDYLSSRCIWARRNGRMAKHRFFSRMQTKAARILHNLN